MMKNRIKKIMIMLMFVFSVFTLACQPKEIIISCPEQVKFGTTTSIELENTESTAVKWSSSDKEIIEVVAIGRQAVLYAVSVGTADVIATVDGVTYKKSVTVTHDESKIIIEGPNYVAVGGEAILTAKTDLGEVEWSINSINAKLFTEGNTAKITGLFKGEMIVTATYGNYFSRFKMSILSEGVKIICNETVFIGKPVALKLNHGQATSWSVDNEELATINDGVLTPLKAGMVTITATTAYETVTLEVRVFDPEGLAILGNVSAYVGESLKLSVNTFGAVVWTSQDNVKIKVVNDKAIVTADKAGTYTITAMIEGIIESVKVTFMDYPTVVLTGDNTMFAGDTQTLVVDEFYTNKKLVWESSDATIATVKDGVVEAKQAGTVEISVYYDGYKNTLSAFTITILANDDIVLNSKTEIEVGELTYIEVLSNSEVNGLNWSIDNTDIALLKGGILLPVKEGTLEVTATTANGKEASIVIKVNKIKAKEESQVETEYVDNIMKSMTLDQKIGQMFVIGFSGTTMPDAAIEAVREYNFGNFILMAYNVTNGVSTGNLVNRIQDVVLENNNIPALISIDQEGGKIERMTTGATHFLGNMALAATANYQNAYNVGLAVGQEMRYYGITNNYAPVLDVNNNPLNPIIGVRSYGDDPLDVALYGVNMINGLKDGGVMGTVKHFPGHGNTSTDTHLSMPSITTGIDELYKVELAPFIAAIQSGVEAIMTTHIVFNAFDTKYPATLSKKVLNDLLRTELGYTGLVITDGMEMDAIKTNFGYSQSAVLAVNASADILTFTTINNAITAWKAVKNGVNLGTISMETINAAVRRILLSKVRLGLFETNKANDGAYDTTEHVNYNNELAKQALTLAQGEFTGLDKTKKTLIVSTSVSRFPLMTGLAGDNNSFAFVAQRLMANAGYKVDYKVVSNKTDMTNVINDAKKYDQIVFAFDNVKSGKATRLSSLVNTVSANQPEDYVIAIALETPYDILMYNNVDCYICAYEYTPTMVKTVISYLMGEFEAQGKLPIELQ